MGSLSHLKILNLLIGGLEHEFVFPYIGNVIIPSDELHHFSEGLWSTTKQLAFAVVSRLVTVLEKPEPIGSMSGIQDGKWGI
jgi:hypothetical protein